MVATVKLPRQEWRARVSRRPGHVAAWHDRQPLLRRRNNDLGSWRHSLARVTLHENSLMKLARLAAR